VGLIICGTGIVQWRADVRVVRRALDQEELAALVSAAEAGEPFRDLTGADKAMLYLMAAFSGRWSFLTLRERANLWLLRWLQRFQHNAAVLRTRQKQIRKRKPPG